MHLPDYKGGSIVNLMSSISSAFGKKSDYAELRLLPSKELKISKNIVLIVLDGVGFEYIKKKGKNTVFQKYLKGKMTSVFPPTTASAITTFATGDAPQQHAFTGWFMHLKEIGIVAKILKFKARAGGEPFSRYGVRMKDILNRKGFTERISACSYTITKKEIKNSDFTIATAKKSKVIGYSTLNGFFAQIRKAINAHNRKKYIYAYWSEFDSISHDYGVNSRKAERHFRELDKKLRTFIKTVKNTDTTIIVTSDHGLVDSAKDKRISLEDHPKLRECLATLLCGDARLAYCYVRPSKKSQFEKYVKTGLKRCCRMLKSEDLIKKNYFGLFKENPRLSERIGDYALIMKDDYVFKDNISDKKSNFNKGNHGGTSKEEMFVPLIVINA